MKSSWLALLLTPCLAFASYSNYENEFEDNYTDSRVEEEQVSEQSNKKIKRNAQVASLDESMEEENDFESDIAVAPESTHEEEAGAVAPQVSLESEELTEHNSVDHQA